MAVRGHACCWRRCCRAASSLIPTGHLPFHPVQILLVCKTGNDDALIVEHAIPDCVRKTADSCSASVVDRDLVLKRVLGDALDGVADLLHEAVAESGFTRFVQSCARAMSASASGVIRTGRLNESGDGEAAVSARHQRAGRPDDPRRTWRAAHG